MGRQLEALTKKLNLTPDQVTQVKAIDDDTKKQSMAVRSDASLASADKRGKMMEIHKAAQDKIRAVLNDEQKTKYDAMQAQMQERRQSREGAGGPHRLLRRDIGKVARSREWPEEEYPPAFLRGSPAEGGWCGYNEGQ